jgi:DNA helicase HerA-like ATPase
MNVSIFGQSGTGKSTFASNLVGFLWERGKKVIVVSDNFDDISRVADVLDADLVHVEITDENWASIPYEDIIRKYDYIGFEMVNLLKEEIADVMDRISDTIYNIGNAIVYIDEAHIFLPRFGCSVGAQRLLRGGRKHAITNIVVTQQLSDLVDVALKQAHYMVIFKLTQHRELEVIKVYVDPEEVKALDLYECIILNRVKGTKDVVRNDEIGLMI